MINFIEYFYNIKVDKIIYEKGYYSFSYKNNLYKLYIYNENMDIDSLYKINKSMLNSTLVSEIILNKNNEIISVNNNIAYILIKIYVNVKKNILLEEINFISNSLEGKNININWGKLWEDKIDYLEDLIGENGKKYPIMVDSFNYFVGMAENAISYYNSIVFDSNYKITISHKKIRLDDTIEALYNPLNIIFDFRVRDVAEYIKFSFFNNNTNIFNEIKIYLKNNYLSLTEVKLLVSRLLYPSFYFDMYDDIMIDEKEEKILTFILSRLNDYEIYLKKVIELLANNYDIEEIMWIKKNHI